MKFQVYPKMFLQRCSTPYIANSLRSRKEQLYIYTSSNNNGYRIGTGIFSYQFCCSLRFNNSLFHSNLSVSEKCALHQLASVLYLIETKQELFRDKNVYFYTNLPKPTSEINNSLHIFHTLLLKKQKLNCSLSFVESKEYHLHYAKSAAQVAIQSQSLHGSSIYITLHNHHKLSVTSLYYE